MLTHSLIYLLMHQLSLQSAQVVFNSTLFIKCLGRQRPSLLSSVGPSTRPVCWTLQEPSVALFEDCEPCWEDNCDPMSLFSSHRVQRSRLEAVWLSDQAQLLLLIGHPCIDASEATLRNEPRTLTHSQNLCRP